MTTTAAAGLEVVFLGTPTFAVPSLRALVAAPGHRVSLVVTAPDRPAGRGLRPRPSPVKVAARELDLRVTTVAPREGREVAAVIKRARPAVVVVVAWGGLLNAAARDAARLAVVNVHPSLLPRWRGAAPIERALMAGDTVTGTTIMHVARRLDAGDVILQEPLPIPTAADAGVLRPLLAAQGAGLLVKALDLLAAGGAPRIAQDEAAVTLAPKLGPADERIDWEMTAQQIINRTRGLSPTPGTYFLHKGRRVKIKGAAIVSSEPPGPTGAAAEPGPGVIVDRGRDNLVVAAGQGSYVELHEVQPAGAKVTTAAGFAHGRRLRVGDQLDQGG